MLLLLAILLANGLPGPVTGDFDHDGRPDVAAVMREGGEAYVLTVKRGAAPDAPARLPLGKGFPETLETAQASAVQTTACAKGAGPRTAPCPEKTVAIQKGDLLLTSPESSQAVMKWDGRSFHLEWISD